MCASWAGGATAWATTLAQLTGYEPPREGAPAGRLRKDRGDALVGAAQVLLGVVETHRGEVEDAPASSWVSRLGGGGLTPVR